MEKATVVDLVLKYPEERGEETAIIFLDTKGQEKQKYSFNGLREDCVTIASNLLARTKRREVILLLTEDQAAFVAGFFGTMLAGCIPAPLSPFKNIKDRQGYGRMLRILKNGSSKCILAEESQSGLIAAILESESLSHVKVITIESLKAAAAVCDLTETLPGDIAYLQYTSGSTSEPKGVVLRHRNVMNNLAKMLRVFRRTERVRMAGWIPFHHDMGLVGHVFSVLYESGLGVFMPANAFISSPHLWLSTISKYKANTSAAPNFAFEHCTRKVTADTSLDLSCWKYAYVGSETVSLSVLNQFYEKFGAVGFSRNTFKPVYGLAEITLLAAGGTYGLDEVEADIIEKETGRHQTRPLMPYLIDEYDKITIINTQTGLPCAEGATGEIIIESPSNSDGYYEDIAEGKSRGNVIHTGDIGFISKGLLYVSGRSKEVVIIRGVNYAAEDLESCARHEITELQTGSQTVCASAIDEAGERFLVFQEIHRHTTRETMEMVSANIKANLVSNYGIVPAEVIFVANGLIPRTRNYKVSRNECMGQYLSGNLQVIYSDVTGSSAESEITDIDDPVVIVGMACRFPGGADSPEKFWALLEAGADAVTEVPLSRWDNDLFYDERPAVPGKVSTKWAGFIDQIDYFDASLFEISAYEAPELDPQQRLLLETSWRLIENTGIKKNALTCSGTGVFIGMSTNDYLYMKIKLSPGMEGFNAYSGLGNSNSVAANRLSYFYDLKGPSLTVDTACSSSMTALHLAAQAILNGSCTQAIAGGVNAILSPGPTITLSQFGMMSPEGRCKTFDAGADGYVRAEGCGLVMLKRRSEAEKDGNSILAVLSASAIGQDGHSPGITFPNGKAQYQLISQTLAKAGLRGSDIGYVEAHGTGTSSGDPVEMEQVKKLYGVGLAACYVGSVKANLGHLEAGAGIASIIKSVLMIQKAKVPPQIHLKTLNPRIQLDGTRLKIGTELIGWDPSQPRRIAVSSFGFGGSLAHAILSAPEMAGQPAAGVPSPFRFAQRSFVFSAASARGLLEQAKDLSNWLESNPRIAIDDLCLTQAKCRSDLKHRKYFLVNSLATLKGKLDAFIAEPDAVNVKALQPGRVCFLFTGQGEHYIFMGKILYQRFGIFRAAFDRCAAVVEQETGGTVSLKEIAFEIKDTYFFHDRYMQPILFAVQYALGTLWQECGVSPDYLVGHSMGEYAAACLAGCFDPETGMAILLKRAMLVEKLEYTGMMVTLFTGHEEIRKVMDADRMQIGAINSDKKTVISGENDAVVEVMKHFEEQGVEFYHLKTSHAFHSHLMQPVAAELEEFIKKFSFKRPDKKWISAYKGKEMHEAPDAAYWVGHLLGTVNFKGAMEQLPAEELIHFIEVGPGASTLVAANETLHLKDALMLRSMNFRKGERTEDYFLFDSLGKLYQTGADIKLEAVLEGRIYPAKVPGQKFMQQSYWMEGINAARLAEFASPAARSAAANKPAEATGEAEIYALKWKNAGPVQHTAEQQKTSANWIVIAEAGVFATDIILRIKKPGDTAYSIGIETGQTHKKFKPDFMVSEADDKERWADIIAGIIYRKSREDAHDWRIIFVAPGIVSAADINVPALEKQAALSAGLLIPLMQAMKKSALVAPVWVVTRQSQLVESAEDARAALNICHAPVWGFAKTLFLEHPELRGGLIDCGADTDAADVVAKINKPRGERVVALRNGVQYIEQIVANKAANVTPGLSLRADGVYIITGGLGGLGLKCAEWVVSRGGRHLVLISRRKFPVPAEWAGIAPGGPDYSIVQQLLNFQKQGVKVEVISLDVRDTEGLEAVFAGFDQDNIAVRGVIHAAGVNWFGKVMELDKEKFLDTLKVKVSAAWALHRLCLNRDLDCFILFSSVSALWGSVELSHYSAANYFMDMLSMYRWQAGLPSLCVDWGPWADVGMSAEAREAGVLQKLGFSLMTPLAALNAMQKELAARTPLSLIANVDWGKFSTFIDFSTQPSLFETVRPQANDEGAGANTGVELILKSPPEKALRLIEDAVRIKLRNVMLIESSDVIDREQRFNFLGMDSLMSISFAAELEHYFGIKLPNTLAYNYPNIRAVTDFIYSVIYTEEGQAAAPPAPETLPEPIAAAPEEAGPGLYKLVSPARANSKIKIFCFPYLGAGASVYEKWAGFFNDNYELIAVQTPGREERSDIAPFVSMPELIDALVADFEEPAADFVFFGHSFGALIAYELYNALKQNGKKLPVKIFLSGCEAPLSQSKSRLHELPDSEFIDEIISKYHNGSDVLERKQALSNNSTLLRADVQVLELYRSGNHEINIPLTVIAGMHDHVADAGAVKSWLALATADFSIRYINGGHDLVKEHGAELANIITGDLHHYRP